MILEYPNCAFDGCDIVQVAHQHPIPNGVNFTYGNVLEGLTEYPDNTFDFVHMRLFILALREVEWPVAIKDILRVTKPGGMIQLLEFDLKVTGGSVVVGFIMLTKGIFR
jgi:ubiquinone/menaquinone biosynthesis C-methylase UbiE